MTTFLYIIISATLLSVGLVETKKSIRRGLKNFKELKIFYFNLGLIVLGALIMVALTRGW